MVPEEFSIKVIRRGFSSRNPFAQAGHGTDVGSAAVIVSSIAFNASLEITVQAARAKHSFVVEAVSLVSSDEQASTDVALITVTACAIIEMARVVAVAIFDEGHDRICMVASVVLADEAYICIDAVRIDVGARVGAQVVTTHGNERRKGTFQAVFFLISGNSTGKPICRSKICPVKQGTYSSCPAFGYEFRIRRKGTDGGINRRNNQGRRALFFDNCRTSNKACINGFSRISGHIVRNAVHVNTIFIT